MHTLHSRRHASNGPERRGVRGEKSVLTDFALVFIASRIIYCLTKWFQKAQGEVTLELK